MKHRAIRSFRDDAGRRFSRWVEVGPDEVGAGEVTIRSRFAAINYKDARAVSGAGNVIKRFPCVPGIEVSGVVEASSDPRFREGDAVTVQGGQEFGIRHDGAFSEIVRVPADWVHPIPEGFDAFSVVALGIGAYTSAVAVETLEAHGVVPGDGEVIVTGATGGCSSFAIDMLAGLGHRVVAMTGKAAEHDYLKRIGAARVVGRDILQRHVKPLDEQLWSAAIDAVGGAPLDFVLRTMRKRGVVAPFGNAAGETFTTSIYPFILRSVVLAGVNANHPLDRRTRAWTRMTADLKPRHLDDIVHRVPFAKLIEHCDALIAGGARGRGVVVFD
ncbi:MAG: acryloyl-CoA reductase [Burkholderiales bacterium]|jgi:putative YhdH/YhfP family quinone oxidoreductase